MRILFINPVGQVGGAERVLLDCVASIRLAEPGHEIHLLLMDDGPLADEAHGAGRWCMWFRRRIRFGFWGIVR